MTADPKRRRSQHLPVQRESSMADFFSPETPTTASLPKDIVRLLDQLPVTVPPHHTRILRLLDRLVCTDRLCCARLGDQTTFWDIVALTPANVLPSQAETAEFLLGHLGATPLSFERLLQDQADACHRCRGPNELRPVMAMVLSQMAAQGVIILSPTVPPNDNQAGIPGGWILAERK